MATALGERAEIRLGEQARERLVQLPPYARGPAADDIFWTAMEEAMAHHARGNEAFGRLRAGWGTARSRHLDSLPYIHVNVFKTRLLLSVPSTDLVRHLYSSGTTGQTSQNPLDALSEGWHRRLLAALYRNHDLPDTVPCDVLWLMLDPDEHADMAAVYSFSGKTALAPVRSRFNAVQHGILQVDAALAWLSERSHRNSRLRIIGLSPFIFKLLEVHRARGGAPFQFHEDSFVLTGGGWKAAQSEAIPRQVFIDSISHGLGIPQHHLRDHFGMVEHAVIYSECAYHRHHIPAYSRVLVRHPGTLDVVPCGEAGLLQVITPLVHSIPAVSILTTDWAELDDTPCACGRPAPTLTILRRAGVQKNRGCAISSAELLERS